MSGAAEGRLRATRLVSAVTALLAAALLGVFAISGGGAVTRHTKVERIQVAQISSTPAASTGENAATPAPQSTLPATNLLTTLPVSSPNVVTAATVTAPPSATPSAPTTPPTGAATSSLQPSDLPACPLGLKSPANPGGLQSLIPFAPFFGPFSSEAFAAAPLFQPFLEAIGPLLVAFAAQYETVAPSLAPLVAQLESLENEGFNAILPLYGPYRAQFLAAESTLATALAPFTKAVAVNAGTSCLVDIEATLTAAGASSG
jgi:hypothetical protein